MTMASGCPEGHAAARLPVHDDEVLERLPARSRLDADRLGDLRERLRRSPGDSLTAAELAAHYFDRALASGDPRYVGYAGAVLSRFADPLPPRLRLIRGQLRQYRHDFAGALDDLAAASAGGLVEADAWRGAILLVQADYDAAARACDALAAAGKPVLAGGCRGLHQAYTGRLAPARHELETALGRTADDAQRQWLHTRLGEVAAWRGEPGAAERHFRAALAIADDDVYLLAAWADFLLDNGRPQEVLGELAGREGADSLLLRLAEAARALGEADAARLVRLLDDRFAAARLRGDTTHQAEEARYRLRLLADPQGALELAAANYRIQREPRDARILLEAAVAAGRPEAAKAARDWLATAAFPAEPWRRLALAVGASR